MVQQTPTCSTDLPLASHESKKTFMNSNIMRNRQFGQHLPQYLNQPDSYARQLGHQSINQSSTATFHRCLCRRPHAAKLTHFATNAASVVALVTGPDGAQTASGLLFCYTNSQFSINFSSECCLGVCSAAYRCALEQERYINVDDVGRLDSSLGCKQELRCMLIPTEW
jgi:hypothetical protein